MGMDGKCERSNPRTAIIEPQGHGGISHYTFELCRALAGAGADITLYTKDNYELKGFARNFRLKEGLRVSRLEKVFNRIRRVENSSLGPVAAGSKGGPRRKRVWDLGYIRAFRTRYMEMELLLRFLVRGIRVAHFQWAWPSPESVRFVRLLKLFGIRVVYTAHNLLPHDDPSRKSRLGAAAWYHSADRVIVHSRANAEEMRKLFGAQADKLSVIPHGNYGFFEPFTGGRGEARRILGIPAGKKVVLFFGLIRRYKGLENLLAALRRARAVDRELYLVIAGKLIPYGERTPDSFRALFGEMGIGESVLFRPDYVPMDAVGAYFAAADVIALPYLKTYQSGIVHLAYSFERPVIATRTGGLPEVVRDGKSGILVPVGDVGGFAEALVEIFRDGERLAGMGRYARHLSGTEFSWDAIARRHMALYEEVAAGAPEAREVASREEGLGPSEAAVETVEEDL